MVDLTRRAAAGLALAAAASPGALAKPRGDTVLSADGTEIVFDVAGRGQRTVILVHGWCCDRTYWDAQWESLSKLYRVARLDLAGHGASGKTRENYTMASFGEDVAAVANALGAGPIALVGHSMGGAVITAAAPALKARLAGLIGVDTFDTVGRPAPTPEAAAALEPQLAPFRADFRAATAGFVKNTFFTPLSNPALVERVVNGMSGQDPRIGLSSLYGLVGFNHVPLLRAIEAPIIALNAPGTIKDFNAARQQAPNFEEIIFSGQKHFLHMEAPTQFNPVLEGVLKRLLR